MYINGRVFFVVILFREALNAWHLTGSAKNGRMSIKVHKNGIVFTLSDDPTALERAFAFNTPEGKRLILDLNGYTLN